MHGFWNQSQRPVLPTTIGVIGSASGILNSLIYETWKRTIPPSCGCKMYLSLQCLGAGGCDAHIPHHTSWVWCPPLALDFSFLLKQTLEGSDAGLSSWVPATDMGDMDWTPGSSRLQPQSSPGHPRHCAPMGERSLSLSFHLSLSLCRSSTFFKKLSITQGLANWFLYSSMVGVEGK